MTDTRVRTVRLVVTQDAYGRILDAMKDRTELLPGVTVTGVSSADLFADSEAYENALNAILDRPHDAERIADAALEGAV